MQSPNPQILQQRQRKAAVTVPFEIGDSKYKHRSTSLNEALRSQNAGGMRDSEQPCWRCWHALAVLLPRVFLIFFDTAACPYVCFGGC